MARGVNKALIIGRIGTEPRITTLQNGSKIVNISLATDESYTDKKTNQKVKKTEWHSVVFFNKIADIAAQYLHKGSQVYIEGSLRTRKYMKQEVEHYTTEIIAKDMQMLDGKADGKVAIATQQPQQATVQKQEDKISADRAFAVFNQSKDTDQEDIPF